MQAADGPQNPVRKFRTLAQSAMAANIIRSFRGPEGFSDEYQAYGTSERSLKLSLVAVLSYLLIGTLSFKLLMDNWTVIDAMYFTTTTFTTVGYGDLSPASAGERIWGIAFVIFGVIILGGIALSIIFDRLFSMYEEVSKEMELGQYIHLLNVFGGNMVIENTRRDKSLCQEVLHVFLQSLMLIIGLVIPSLAIGYLEGWSLVNSLYFCAMTATTGE